MFNRSTLAELIHSTEIADMMGMWKIESMMNDTHTNRNHREQQILINVTSESMRAAIHHEKLIQSKGHSSKFVRSSKLSNEIAHTSYMAKAIEAGLSIERTDSGI